MTTPCFGLAVILVAAPWCRAEPAALRIAAASVGRSQHVRISTSTMRGGAERVRPSCAQTPGASAPSTLVASTPLVRPSLITSSRITAMCNSFAHAPTGRRSPSRATTRGSAASRTPSANMSGNWKPSRWFPVDAQPSAVPLTIVCGPVCAGKTTWVRQQAQPDDVVIDLDEIRAKRLNRPISHGCSEGLSAALNARNRRIKALAHEVRNVRAWLIVGAPTAAERNAWAMRLRPSRVVVMPTPVAKCLARLARRNPESTTELGVAVGNWWRDYQPLETDEIVLSTEAAQSDP